MITVLGASGFIGSHVVAHLERLDLEHHAPGRGEPLEGRQLGDLIYCIGLTADFRERPLDAIDAHIGFLTQVVRTCSFDSILYLSSTRVYLGGTGREDDDLRVNPTEGDDLYNLSKLTGEAITLSLGGRGRVARLSNVYGPGQSESFLAEVLHEAGRRGTVTLRSTLESTRDFINVDDVARLLLQIARGGRHRIYNVASGIDVSNADLVAALPGCHVEVAPDAPTVRFPSIDVSRLREEFDVPPARLLDHLRRT